MHNSTVIRYDGPFIYQSRTWPLNEGMCIKQVLLYLSVFSLILLSGQSSWVTFSGTIGTKRV